MKRAIGYVETITGGLKKELDIIDTNNVTINTVLNAKYQEANDKKIVLILNINDLSRLEIKDDDLVVLLSNLLNNAIESCERSETEKKMWVKIIDEEEMTIISIKNTSKDVANVENGRIITIKRDKKSMDLARKI